MPTVSAGQLTWHGRRIELIATRTVARWLPHVETRITCVRIDWASDLIYRALGDDEGATVDEGGNLYEVAIG